MRVSPRPSIVVAVFLLACAHSCSPAPEPPPATGTTAEAPARPCEPAPDRLCPTDEAAGDAELAAYRNALLEAVERRDMAAFRGMVDPKVRTSFGGNGGFEELIRQWETPSGSPALWEELETILRGGGAFRGEGEERSFWAPYLYAIWPDDVDAFENVAATGREVVVRERPDVLGSELARVDHEILELLRREEESDAWVRVRTSAGIEGWVAADEVRSPIDYRAGFSRAGGQWRMTALVAGD